MPPPQVQVQVQVLVLVLVLVQVQVQYLSELLFDQPIVCTISSADVQAAFSAIIGRIQRFKGGSGGDQSYLSTVLCCFVEQLASKTPDWLNYVRFLILPFDPVGVAARVSQYVGGATVSHLPDDDSCQKFVPFIGLVKVGVVEQNFLSTSVDSDDIILGSPPSQSGAPISITSTPPPSPSTSCSGEVMGLQVDYWSSQGEGGRRRREEKEVGMKNTLKNNFRSLQVSRISGGELSLTVVTKEKNKKVMFLSKKLKEKEAESRSQFVACCDLSGPPYRPQPRPPC
ncbi:hypothetical protein INR49_023248 [Caranx melampygus]|nr:hypothetical protein INR49_023248 [Caranx melampygus]